MLPPARDVASRTAAGETRTERLPLNRYYAYYPVYLWSDCLWTEDIDEISAAHRALLNECFRIPVPDSETLEVTVSKDEAGRVVDVYAKGRTWTRIDFDGRQGYVFTKFIEMVQRKDPFQGPMPGTSKHVAVGYVLLRALKGKVDWNRFG